GRNVQIEYRRAAGDANRLADFAKELVALQPDVIFAVTTPTVAALLRETRTLPIVFAQVSDPVGSGFVASLDAAPGVNVHLRSLLSASQIISICRLNYTANGQTLEYSSEA